MWNIKNAFPVALLLAASLVSSLPLLAYAQNVSNPLIRPPSMLNAGAGTNESEKPGAARNTEQNVGVDDADLRAKAERKITQEDLSIRQQALNLPTVPTPLLDIFNNMQVTAVVNGAVVLRRVDQPTFTSVSTSSNSNTNQSANTPNGQAPANPSSVSSSTNVPGIPRSTAVLRLPVGQSLNLNGYMLRANVRGVDIFVEWLSNNGNWVNVFFGSVESSNGGISTTPANEQLLKVETSTFDYLKPKLTTQTFSGALNNGVNQQQGLNNGGFGSSNPFFGVNQGGGLNNGFN